MLRWNKGNAANEARKPDAAECIGAIVQALEALPKRRESGARVDLLDDDDTVLVVDELIDHVRVVRRRDDLRRPRSPHEGATDLHDLAEERRVESLAGHAARANAQTSSRTHPQPASRQDQARTRSREAA